jgi:hypothetical protein
MPLLHQPSTAVGTTRTKARIGHEQERPTSVATTPVHSGSSSSFIATSSAPEWLHKPLLRVRGCGCLDLRSGCAAGVSATICIFSNDPLRRRSIQSRSFSKSSLSLKSATPLTNAGCIRQTSRHIHGGRSRGGNGRGLLGYLLEPPTGLDCAALIKFLS